MRKTISLGFLLAFALPASAQVLQRVSIRTPNAPQIAHQLQSDGYDVLEGSIEKGSFQLVVSPESMTELMALGFRPRVLETGRPFYEIEAERMRDAEGASPDAPPAGYPDLANVIAQMQTAAANFPSICQFVDLTATYGMPKTFGNRSLYAVKISDNVNVDEDEQAVLIVSAHHCRETVTPVTALHAMDQFTQLYGVDPMITNLVDTHEIWIAPVWNPDGYNYVWVGNNLWRKNRHAFANGIGVDLNRNYDFGWSAPCRGSSNVSSETYRGPSPASEVETQTMKVWSEDVRFSKVLDFHSFGRETLWEYGCDPHPLSNYLQNEAISLSQAAGYGSKNRPPSADGEHFEWQLNAYGAYSFLMEISTAFQPPFSSAQAEAAQVFPAIVQLINQPVPISGHVTDALTGLPVEATITTRGLNFQRSEVNRS
ncbi:MAG TPA: hypothetical protein ENJ09_14695, partial [Planctomycetes bacterium]|nr:hypothetical protein [Planctomycetota bacterium]